MEGYVIHLAVDLDEESIGTIVNIETVDSIVGGTNIDDLPAKDMYEEYKSCGKQGGFHLYRRTCSQMLLNESNIRKTLIKMVVSWVGCPTSKRSGL